jgi:hypothetical protein
MAASHPSASLRPPAPPMASPGFGKRTAPDQKPRTAHDFAHLSAREAYIASFIDRLPDGAAIDIKTLAKELAAFGQQAVRSALRLLEQAGHLFRRRETVGEGRTQWVWRTYFSRTARSESWWRGVARGDVPRERTEPTPEHVPAPAPVEERPRDGAYATLAGVGLTDRRMSLSATECAELRPLVEEWFARGATEPDVVRALTTDLPPEVHVPGAFARKRLTTKLPPERQPAPPPCEPLPLMECEGCGAPGRALPGGHCRTCRDDGPREGWLGESFAEDFRRKVDAVRAGIAGAGRGRGRIR